MLGGGEYATGLGLAALFISLVLLLVAIVCRERLGSGQARWIAAPLLALLMLVRFGLITPLVVWSSLLLTVLAMGAGLGTWGTRASRVWSWALVLTWIGILVMWIVVFPNHIDVISMIRDGGLRLIHGQDPYTGHYRSTTIGVRSLPYTYSPVTVLLAAPAAWLGNVRYTNVVLAAISVWALYQLSVRGTDEGPLQARFLILPFILSVPLMIVMVWSGWTEAYVLAPFFLWLLWRDSHPRLAVACLAIAIGAKYTLLPVLVPLFLWSPRMRRELLRRA